MQHDRFVAALGAMRFGAAMCALLVLPIMAAPLACMAGKESDLDAEVRVAFNADCETMLVKEIGRAKEEVVVAIYNITRRSIVAALGKAAKRGVTVRLKYDDNSQRESDGMPEAIENLKKQGVQCAPVKLGEKEGRMHNKFTIVDGKRVITGSFNYTSSASTVNYENLVLIESAEVAKLFAAEFEAIESR